MIRLRYAAPLLLSLAASPVMAGTASLVADVNPEGYEVDDSSFSGPSFLQTLGDGFLMTSHSQGPGTQFWTSDGTLAGTQALFHFCEAGCSSSGSTAELQGVAFFFMDKSVFEADLWRSDGTRAGTYPLGVTLDIASSLQHGRVLTSSRLIWSRCAGPDEGPCQLWASDTTREGTGKIVDFSDAQALGHFTATGEKAFFAVERRSGRELWLTDGTSTGTRLVRPLPETFQGFVAVVGQLLFFMTEGGLWTSDGTTGGTRSLADSGVPRTLMDFQLVALDGKVYFAAVDETGGADLWVSDGTVRGTRRVTDFAASLPFPFGWWSRTLTKLGDRLLFVADDGITGLRLWSSLGTPATTAPLAGCVGGCPQIDAGIGVLRVGGRALFSAFDPVHGSELWVTDGTGPGTTLLRDICAGPCDAGPAMASVLGSAWIVGRNANGSIALLRSDGTIAGTRRVATLPPGAFGEPSDGFPLRFSPVVAGGKVGFLARDPVYGMQLWTSDGTPEGTLLASMIATGGRSSNPSSMRAFGDGVTFFSWVGEAPDLWVSDGTPAGTRNETPAASWPPAAVGGTVVAGDVAFFLTTFGELWRTDGTTAGTFPLQVPPRGSETLDISVFDGHLLGIAEDFFRTKLMVFTSDGTPGGTKVLFDLPSVQSANSLTVLDSELYFIGTSSEDQRDYVWRSDGTAAGTRPLISASTLSDPQFTRIGDQVFFAGAGGELWVSDGTAAGTRLLVTTEAPVQAPRNLTAFRGALWFSHADVNGHRTLWRSDGTPAGTAPALQVEPFDGFGRSASTLAVAGDRLFFAATDPEHGAELWVTDGTPSGTRLVRDVEPGPFSSQPRSFFAASGRLYFVAGTTEHGVELWESDGTDAGTRLVHDIAPGAQSSFPESFVESGGRLFFTADDTVVGREPWVLPLDPAAPSCVPTDTALCLNGGRYRVEAWWRDFAGRTGLGHAVPLTADTGYFWFFQPTNVEVVLKVLDGRGVNGHVWAFYGALSNVEYTLTVTDTLTGATRHYPNPGGRFGSVGDTEAFGPLGAAGAPSTLGPAAEPGPAPLVREGRAAGQKAPCVAAHGRLCLGGGRFAVEIRWRDFAGRSGAGAAVPVSSDTGYFWFFDQANVETVVKVLDGRELNGKFWVFYAALTNVEYTLTVTDTETGTTRTYTNPRGRFASVGDIEAF